MAPTELKTDSRNRPNRKKRMRLSIMNQTQISRFPETGNGLATSFRTGKTNGLTQFRFKSVANSKRTNLQAGVKTLHARGMRRINFAKQTNRMLKRRWQLQSRLNLNGNNEASRPALKSSAMWLQKFVRSEEKRSARCCSTRERTFTKPTLKSQKQSTLRTITHKG